MPKKLFLVDGSNQAFRAFFAIQNDMRSPNGFPTRALFGFTAMLRKMLDTDQPDYMCVLFDKGLSFRNDLYPDYKGQRPDMPEDLRDYSLVGVRVHFRSLWLMGDSCGITTDIIDLRIVALENECPFDEE